MRCQKDVKQFCSDANPEEEGAVLLCLRAHRTELRPICQVGAVKCGRDAVAGLLALQLCLQPVCQVG